MACRGCKCEMPPFNPGETWLWLFFQNATQVQLHGGKTPIVLYQEMKLQFELHVSIEPAAASLQRFNWSGPPPRTRNFLKEHLVHVPGVPWEFSCSGRGAWPVEPLQGSCSDSMLTYSSNCTFISWYNTILWNCTWVAFWKNSHWLEAQKKDVLDNTYYGFLLWDDFYMLILSCVVALLYRCSPFCISSWSSLVLKETSQSQTVTATQTVKVITTVTMAVLLWMWVGLMSISEPGLHKKLWRGLFPKKTLCWTRAPVYVCCMDESSAWGRHLTPLAVCVRVRINEWTDFARQYNLFDEPMLDNSTYGSSFSGEWDINWLLMAFDDCWWPPKS